MAGEGWEIPPEELERPGRRYARAHLEFDGAVIRTHVNSRERRQGLLRILTEAGGEPEVIEESRIDPALDLPTPGEAAAPRGPADEGMSEEATLAWAQTWMDEKVPALAGLTPRQAVGSERHRPLLEALLREFEYRADQRRRSGGGSPDVDWLREELGMPARDVSPFG